MAAPHFDTIPEEYGRNKFTGVQLPTGTVIPGRAGKPSGMGKFKPGQLVTVDEQKGRYGHYDVGSFYHHVQLEGGRSASVPGEETHRIRPNKDPDDLAKEAAWQAHMKSIYNDRRGA